MSWGPLYVERMGWFLYRVERSFGVGIPQMGALTLGDYIHFVAEGFGTPADAVLDIRRYPSLLEVREEAFRRFQKAIADVGGVPPTSMDSPLDSANWLPLPKPQEKWEHVAKLLQCEFPLLWPGKGFFLVFGLGYGVMLALWVGLLYALGFDKDPVTLSDWVTGGLFTIVMLVSSFIIPGAIAEWTSTRKRIPFASLADLVDAIRQTADPPIEDFLVRPIQSTIRDSIQDIASEEFAAPREEVGPEFSLVPEHLQARWENHDSNS